MFIDQLTSPRARWVEMNLETERAHFLVNIYCYFSLSTLGKWSKTATVPLLSKLLTYLFHDIWGRMKYCFLYEPSSDVQRQFGLIGPEKAGQSQGN